MENTLPVVPVAGCTRLEESLVTNSDDSPRAFVEHFVIVVAGYFNDCCARLCASADMNIRAPIACIDSHIDDYEHTLTNRHGWMDRWVAGLPTGRGRLLFRHTCDEGDYVVARMLAHVVIANSAATQSSSAPNVEMTMCPDWLRWQFIPVPSPNLLAPYHKR